jgi:protein-S-isoprenylcysteine O-methyltransferase Ste14
MTTTTDTLDKVSSGDASSSASFVKRASVFVYGVSSYAVGVAALVAWILYMLGVFEFAGAGIHLAAGAAVLFNLGMMVAFGLQHSIMARPAFKKKWTKLVPHAVERSTFVLATGLILGPMLLLWQPMPTTIWHVSIPVVQTTLVAAALAGWAYLFLASFAINHFELFGLRQVYQYFRGEEVTSVPFKERLMYRFDRHPIMTGALIGMWVTPHMRLDHLLFAATATVYLVIGVYFEERSLRRQWGATYDDYRDRVGSIVPSFSGRRES